jgi:hypothetical protein
MKTLLKKLIQFLIPLILIIFSGLFLPPTPRASKSLLFANQQKDSLLQNTLSPRMIFVGGSNLSFGLNSPLIKDSLIINPINLGLHAQIGVKYMLENTLKYIKKGDMVVISLEYSLFYKSYDYVSEELFRTVFDVNPKKAELLSFKQLISMVGYLPKFSLTKFKPNEYFDYKESKIYSVKSFNKFGDVVGHLNLKNRKFNSTEINGVFNKNVIDKIKEFELIAKKLGALVYITFPAVDEVFFERSRSQIYRVEKELKENNFILLGNTERYKMDSKLMFNTEYHLNKKGIELRTFLFIEDFKNSQKLNFLSK